MLRQQKNQTRKSLEFDAAQISKCISIVFEVITNRSVIVARELIESSMHCCYSIDLIQLGFGFFDDFLLNVVVVVYLNSFQ